MHPTKFLGCNSKTLPFLIPAGGQGPARLQKCRQQGWASRPEWGLWGVPAGEITRQDKSLGLPEDLSGGTRLHGETTRD